MKKKNKMLVEQLEKIFNKIDVEWKEYQSTRHSKIESEKRSIQ